jgi:hypothetical protein
VSGSRSAQVTSTKKSDAEVSAQFERVRCLGGTRSPLRVAMCDAEGALFYHRARDCSIHPRAMTRKGSSVSGSRSAQVTSTKSADDETQKWAPVGMTVGRGGGDSMCAFIAWSIVF